MTAMTDSLPEDHPKARHIETATKDAPKMPYDNWNVEMGMNNLVMTPVLAMEPSPIQ